MSTQAERLEREIDIEPVPGLNALPKSDEPTEEQEPEIQAESPDLEHPEHVEETEPEEAETESLPDDWKMAARDFAKEVGLERRELYHNVTFPTDRGEQSLSRILDDYNGLVQSQDQWQTERQQLQEQASKASQQAITQPVSQEAEKLAMQAEFLEQQYGQIQWDQINPGERADLKVEYDRQINGLRRKAQETQQAYQVDLEGKRRAYQSEAHRKTLSQIPEWNSREIFESETGAMTNMLRSVYQMPEDQIAMIPSDPISMKIIRDLWKLQSKHAEIKQGATKIRKLSRSLKPGSKSVQKGNSLADVGKRVRQAGTRIERQEARLKAQFRR